MILCFQNQPQIHFPATPTIGTNMTLLASNIQKVDGKHSHMCTSVNGTFYFQGFTHIKVSISYLVFVARKSCLVLKQVKDRAFINLIYFSKQAYEAPLSSSIRA